MAYPAPTGPVINQPQGGPATAQWMAAPSSAANCPPGLEYLTQIDQLLINEQVEMLKASPSFKTNRNYEIKNSTGQIVYFAAEDTCYSTQNLCSNGRPFEVKICDTTGREVIHLDSPVTSESCCNLSPLKKVEVQAPPGQTIGYVRQAQGVYKPKFKIMNAEDETVLVIDGPGFTCNLFGDVEFQVYATDGVTHVGQICKQWSGLVKEMFIDANNFGVTFPLDLDLKLKATLLGAVFLIDFLISENKRHH